MAPCTMGVLKLFQTHFVWKNDIILKITILATLLFDGMNRIKEVLEERVLSKNGWLNNLVKVTKW